MQGQQPRLQHSYSAGLLGGSGYLAAALILLPLVALAALDKAQRSAGEIPIR